MKSRILLLVKGLSLFTVITRLHAQGTAFTYQGRLNDGVNPASGKYDLRFIVYDNGAGGSQQGPILTNSATAVSNGLFTVTLDFGNQFPGAGRWLEIGVRTNGGGTFTALAPRQQLTSAPYAVTAANLAAVSQFNTNVLGQFTTVGGGYGNTASASYATVSGGQDNTASGDFDATVGGGFNNIASGLYATVGGGFGNVASGNGATIPGGGGCTAAGSTSFAAGNNAEAKHNGCFVWADYEPLSFASTAVNQFLIRATGGMGINTAAPETPLHIAGIGGITIGQSATSGGYTALRMDLSAAQNGYAELQAISQGGSSYGNLILQANGGKVGIGKNNPVSALDVNGTVTAIAFNPPSDRNLKEHFARICARDVLDKVAALPISRWDFISDPATQHLGPMAQDFHAAFGLGTDDKHIATVDADGVALAAIQGLNQKLEEQRAENADLKQRLEKLEQLVSRQNGGGKYKVVPGDSRQGGGTEGVR